MFSPNLKRMLALSYRRYYWTNLLDWFSNYSMHLQWDPQIEDRTTSSNHRVRTGAGLWYGSSSLIRSCESSSRMSAPSSMGQLLDHQSHPDRLYRNIIDSYFQEQYIGDCASVLFVCQHLLCAWYVGWLGYNCCVVYRTKLLSQIHPHCNSYALASETFPPYSFCR